MIHINATSWHYEGFHYSHQVWIRKGLIVWFVLITQSQSNCIYKIPSFFEFSMKRFASQSRACLGPREFISCSMRYGDSVVHVTGCTSSTGGYRYSSVWLIQIHLFFFSTSVPRLNNLGVLPFLILLSFEVTTLYSYLFVRVYRELSAWAEFTWFCCQTANIHDWSQLHVHS